MDALALLCNLYGDGPATLKRLRSAGCTSCEALGELEAGELAEILDASPPAARRFLREARVLLERVDARGLEQEESPPLARDPEPTTSIEDPTSPEPLAAEPPEEAPPEVGAADDVTAPLIDAADDVAAPLIDAADDVAAPLIDKVLQTWRERDARGGVEHDVEFDAADEVLSSAELEEQGRAIGTPLRPRIVDGLDSGWCGRLRSQGIHTLEGLAGAEALALSEAVCVGLTQLMRFQFLARRLLSERGQVEAPEPPSMLKPVGRAGPASRLRTAPVPDAPLPSKPVEPITSPHASAGAKFSAAEVPFGVATSSLARELDQAAEQRPRREQLDPPLRPDDEGSGGPFVR